MIRAYSIITTYHTLVQGSKGSILYEYDACLTNRYSSRSRASSTRQLQVLKQPCPLVKVARLSPFPDACCFWSQVCNITSYILFVFPYHVLIALSFLPFPSQIRSLASVHLHMSPRRKSIRRVFLYSRNPRPIKKGTARLDMFVTCIWRYLRSGDYLSQRKSCVVFGI